MKETEQVVEPVEERVIHKCSKWEKFPWFFIKKTEDNETYLTGCAPEIEMKPGQLIVIPKVSGYYVINSVERNDCREYFKEEKLINQSLFRANVTYIKRK